MAQSSKQSRSRRELFTASMRYAVMGFLAAGGAAMFFKRRRLVREGKCINGGICAGCEILGHCDLPAAFSARSAATGENNGGK